MLEWVWVAEVREGVDALIDNKEDRLAAVYIGLQHNIQRFGRTDFRLCFRGDLDLASITDPADPGGANGHLRKIFTANRDWSFGRHQHMETGFHIRWRVNYEAVLTFGDGH